MGQIKRILDVTDEIVYPVTHERAVRDDSGTTLESKLEIIEESKLDFTKTQSLNASQKAQALSNVGISGIDNYPTKNSDHLVKSGGVYSAITSSIGEFDLTEYMSGTTYASLTAALAAMSSVPSEYKKGGMTLKYVQSSDNKYLQYRFLLSTFTATQFSNENNWQKQGAEVTVTQNEETKNTAEQISIGSSVFNIKDKALGDSTGIFFSQTTRVEKNSIILTNDEINNGQHLFWKIKTGSTICFLRVYSTEDTEIANLGSTSTAGEYSGEYIIPANFGYIKVMWGTLDIDYLYSDTANKVLAAKIQENAGHITPLQNNVSSLTTKTQGLDEVFGTMGVFIDSPTRKTTNTVVLDNTNISAGQHLFWKINTGTNIAFLGVYNTNDESIAIFGSLTTAGVYNGEYIIPENFGYIKVMWSDLNIDYLYTEFKSKEQQAQINVITTKVAELQSQNTIQENKLNQVESDINLNTYSEPSEYVFKHIEPSGNVSNSIRDITFDYPVRALKGSKFWVDEGCKYEYALYNYVTGAFIQRVTWITDGSVTTLDDDYQIRIEIANSAESKLDDMSILKHLHMYLYAEPKVGAINQEFEKLDNNIYRNYLQLSYQADNLINVVGASSFYNRLHTVTPPDKYSAWPFIAMLNNKLICLYCVGEQHEATQGAIWVSESANGIIWTPKRKIIDNPNKRDNITGRGFDSNGNLLFWNRVGFTGASTYFELYKTSDGYTFERISLIQYNDVVVQPTDIINIPNVGLISFFHVYGTTRSWGILKSTDDGITWERIYIEQNIAQNLCPTEINGVYVGDGKILAIGRYEGGGNSPAMWQIESSDNGLTWTKTATNIALAGQTASVVFNSSNSKASVYIYNRNNGNLEYREATLSEIWGNPTEWPDATVLTTKGAGQESGNVNACAFGNKQVSVFYSGNSTDTGIYGYLKG